MTRPRVIYAVLRVENVIMENVIMENIIMENVIMENVIMENVIMENVMENVIMASAIIENVILANETAPPIMYTLLVYPVQCTPCTYNICIPVMFLCIIWFYKNEEHVPEGYFFVTFSILVFYSFTFHSEIMC